MVTIYKDNNENIVMSLTQEELNTLIAYIGSGKSSDAENFGREYNFDVLPFFEQEPLFEAMITYIKYNMKGHSKV